MTSYIKPQKTSFVKRFFKKSRACMRKVLKSCPKRAKEGVDFGGFGWYNNKERKLFLSLLGGAL